MDCQHPCHAVCISSQTLQVVCTSCQVARQLMDTASCSVLYCPPQDLIRSGQNWSDSELNPTGSDQISSEPVRNSVKVLFQFYIKQKNTKKETILIWQLTKKEISSGCIFVSGVFPHHCGVWWLLPSNITSPFRYSFLVNCHLNIQWAKKLFECLFIFKGF